MSTAQEPSNKATFRRFRDAVSTGDIEVISKTIDEVVEPNVLFHAPVPTGATGAQAIKQVAGAPSRVPGPARRAGGSDRRGEKVVARNTVTGPTRASTGASH
jgi:hypothetical protein